MVEVISPPASALCDAATRSAHGPVDLRHRLKAATQGDHDAVEQAYADLDLRTPDGLGCYLLANVIALARVHCAIGASEDLPAAIRPPIYLGELNEDLECLGLSGSVPSQCSPLCGVNGIGVAYVVGGSRLGAKLLHRQWLSARDRRVREAGRYLSGLASDGYWPKFLGFLNGLLIDPKIYYSIEVAARKTFRLFGEAKGTASLHLSMDCHDSDTRRGARARG